MRFLLKCTEQDSKANGKVWACFCTQSARSPPLSSMPFQTKWVESFCPLWRVGVSLWAQLYHAEFRLLRLPLGLSRARHEPVAAGLAQENLLYWIWKSLQRSGRRDSYFHAILGLRSSLETAWLRGNYLHGSLTWQFGKPLSGAPLSTTKGLRGGLPSAR